MEGNKTKEKIRIGGVENTIGEAVMEIQHDLDSDLCRISGSPYFPGLLLNNRLLQLQPVHHPLSPISTSTIHTCANCPGRYLWLKAS